MKHVYKAFTRLCETPASTVDAPSGSRCGDARVMFGAFEAERFSGLMEYLDVIILRLHIYCGIR